MKILLGIYLILMVSCSTEQKPSKKKEGIKKDIVFTTYSKLENEYINFNSPKAINKIAGIENEYFNQVEEGISKYYGTEWRIRAEKTYIGTSLTQYEEYEEELKSEEKEPDSLHCTLYAYEGLKAGFTLEELEKLESLHKEQWKNREIAGWSIGYLLVKYFNWRAYLMISRDSEEFNHCTKSYKRTKKYPVWRQPDIPLEEVFIIGEQDSVIANLLSLNEFGWGFSEQGIHTWITRFTKLKECNWLGSPSIKYNYYEYEKPLFITTEFGDYFDYNSHIVIFPEKRIKNDR